MTTKTLSLNDKGNVTLTCYLLDDSKELSNASVRPGVLIMPGGAYLSCSDREAEPVALAYMAEGYHAFVLRYSVGEASAFPQPLHDAEEALETIRKQAGEWRVDPERIAAVGFSAGGHLAAMLGTTGRVRPAALILGYPCTMKSEGGILPHPIPGADEHVTSQTPPAFIFTTCEDRLVPVKNSLRFADALDTAGVPFELHIFQRGQHGLSLAKPHTSDGVKHMVEPTVSQWMAMSVDWLHGLWGEFNADGEPVLSGVVTEFEAYGTDVAIRELWKNERCRNLLTESLPLLADARTRENALPCSLRIVAQYTPDMLPQEKLEELSRKLAEIPLEK